MVAPPPTHTHTLESKETKNSTLECKETGQMLRIWDVKNVNKRKIRLTLVKLESIGLAGGFGWEVPIER